MLALAEVEDPHRRDVEAITAALLERVAAGTMREVRGDVPLADMVDLLVSEQKYAIVAFVECLGCARTLFWGLCVRGAPILRRADPTEAEGWRWEAIPPRERWVGAAARERERTALEVVDFQPGAWFLLQRGDGTLLLDARYSYSALIDDSAVVVLSESERAAYDAGGSDYLDDLQQRIHHSAPYREESPWHDRDLTRLYGDAVAAAIRRFQAG